MPSEVKLKLDDYNPEQQAVILSDAPAQLVRASAGSGKSHNLIGAVLYYRANHPTDRIDVITFTRAATAELRNRLAAEGVTDVNISTIHVWARNFLGVYAALYNFELRIIYENDIRSILHDIIANYRKKVEVDAVYKYICEGMRSNLPDRIKATYDAIERRYVKYKRDNALYDFTDYPLYLYDILKKYDEFILDVDALFVDELQDIDYEQSFVFSRVQARKKFYIGDEKQMIYAFRGASPDIFERIKEGFTTFQLLNNYRSKQEIIDLAMNLYTQGEKFLAVGQKFECSSINFGAPCDIRCVRGYGGDVWVVDPFGSCLHNSSQYVDWQTALTAFINKRPMVLCRTNRMVETVKNLGYLQVSTIHQAKGLEYDNVILVDCEINSIDDLNVMYVGETRARDGLFVASLPQVTKCLQASNLYLL